MNYYRSEQTIFVDLQRTRKGKVMNHSIIKEIHNSRGDLDKVTTANGNVGLAKRKMMHAKKMYCLHTTSTNGIVYYYRLFTNSVN